MAAKTTRTVTHPTLPPEIWLRIFDFATYIPGTMVPEILEQSSLIGKLYTRRYYPALRVALLTKRYLVRVCKQWWHLATPYLYRAVYIGRARCLLSLYSTLKKYAEGEGTIAGVHDLGSWTQRLDVVIRDHPIGGPNTEAERLAGIIRYLPNLAIASFAVASAAYANTFMHPSVFHSLKGNASSLRVLDWSTDGLRPGVSHLEELLRYLPRLQILNCPGLVWANGLAPNCLLSSVNTLVLKWLTMPIGRLDLVDPQEENVSLREVIFDVGWWAQSLWRTFMGQYGGFLTSVQLCAYDGVHPSTLNAFLNIVNTSCPNLRRITISAVTFSHISMEGFSLPPVQYLGLRAEARQQRRVAYRHLFSILAVLRDSATTLQVIQMIDRHNVENLLTRHSQVAIRAFEQKLAGSTFRVEDHNGCLLSGQSSSIPPEI
ncbi:hypothetical protein V8B97DRAFT_2003811 [Scleroderma yunnanense]